MTRYSNQQTLHCLRYIAWCFDKRANKSFPKSKDIDIACFFVKDLDNLYPRLKCPQTLYFGEHGSLVINYGVSTGDQMLLNGSITLDDCVEIEFFGNRIDACFYNKNGESARFRNMLYQQAIDLVIDTVRGNCDGL